MGQPDGFAADPHRMRVVGSAVAESAATVKAGYDGARDRLAPAAGQVPGWAAVDAARAAAETWDGFLSGLHRSLVGVSEAITSAAAGYERADADAAGRTGRAGPR